MPQLSSKPEASHSSLQIDCRASLQQPDLFQEFPTNAQCSSREASEHIDGGFKAYDMGSRDSREDTHQDPTSSHESSRPAECLSPVLAQTHDKVISLRSKIFQKPYRH